VFRCQDRNEEAVVREELPHALVSVARGSGIAGLVAAVAGLAVASAAVWPWYEATAELTMLGTSQDRAVVTLPGLRTVPGAVAGLAGVGAAVLGLLLAVDRHPGWTRRGLLVATAALGVAGVGAWMRRPGLDRFPDDGGALADLRAVVGELPRGVELHLAVRPGPGLLVAVGAAVVIALAVAAARDLDVS
jgi:hypothetical protein